MCVTYPYEKTSYPNMFLIFIYRHVSYKLIAARLMNAPCLIVVSLPFHYRQQAINKNRLLSWHVKMQESALLKQHECRHAH